MWNRFLWRISERSKFESTKTIYKLILLTKERTWTLVIFERRGSVQGCPSQNQRVLSRGVLSWEGSVRGFGWGGGGGRKLSDHRLFIRKMLEIIWLLQNCQADQMQCLVCNILATPIQRYVKISESITDVSIHIDWCIQLSSSKILNLVSLPESIHYKRSEASWKLESSIDNGLPSFVDSHRANICRIRLYEIYSVNCLLQ